MEASKHGDREGVSGRGVRFCLSVAVSLGIADHAWAAEPSQDVTGAAGVGGVLGQGGRHGAITTTTASATVRSATIGSARAIREPRKAVTTKATTTATGWWIARTTMAMGRVPASRGLRDCARLRMPEHSGCWSSWRSGGRRVDAEGRTGATGSPEWIYTRGLSLAVLSFFLSHHPPIAIISGSRPISRISAGQLAAIVYNGLARVATTPQEAGRKST